MVELRSGGEQTSHAIICCLGEGDESETKENMEASIKSTERCMQSGRVQNYIRQQNKVLLNPLNKEQTLLRIEKRKRVEEEAARDSLAK